MVLAADREAGIAAFRQGRSLCLRLAGPLDAAMARGAERVVRRDRGSVRLRLECSGLTDVDALCARLLGTALVAWGAAGDGRSVEIHNLAEGLQRRIAWHPLQSFMDRDELVFFDPDRDPDWGPGTCAS